MADERTKKLIQDKVSTWDKFKTAITPGLDISERERRLQDIANENVRREEQEKAQLEAIRRKRMQTLGSGQQ